MIDPRERRRIPQAPCRRSDPFLRNPEKLGLYRPLARNETDWLVPRRIFREYSGPRCNHSLAVRIQIRPNLPGIHSRTREPSCQNCILSETCTARGPPMLNSEFRPNAPPPIWLLATDAVEMPNSPEPITEI